MLLEEAVPTYHVSGTPCKLLEEAFTTYQEHLASYLEQDVARSQDRLACYLKKLFQRITYPERLARYLQKMLQRITSQERLASYMKKMLQRSRNVFQVT